MQYCGVSAADIQPPRLFQFLDLKIRPIATPPRDLIWLTCSLLGSRELLAQGVIEPSRSPWRAQVLVN